MHFTQKMMYMGFGCLLTLAGYILASMNNDSVAQSGAEEVMFGEITCRGLTVVDDVGKIGVIVSNNEHGGVVSAQGKDGSFASLNNTEHGGSVYAKGKDGGSAQLGTDEHGGIVSATGKGKGSALFDKGSAQLSNNEHGGSLVIFNKGSENVLQAGVGNTGGSGIRTYDKLGYRTGSLPCGMTMDPRHSTESTSKYDEKEQFL